MHWILVLLFSHFLFAPIPLNYSVSQSDAIVRGSVVDEKTGHGIAGATVYAMSDTVVRFVKSDANGNFLFLTLLPGKYRLCAAKSGYVIDCTRGEANELTAGFEYGAKVILQNESD